MTSPMARVGVLSPVAEVLNHRCASFALFGRVDGVRLVSGLVVDLVKSAAMAPLQAANS